MAGTTFKAPVRLLSQIRDKARGSSLKAVHAGTVASLALELWAKDMWTPGPDPIIPGEQSERLFLQLDDEAYEMALMKRRMSGPVNLSAMYRRALQDWVDGKWDIGLVRR